MSKVIKFAAGALVFFSISACSYQEIADNEQDQSRAGDHNSATQSGTGSEQAVPDNCAAPSGTVQDSIVRYTVKRNSKLDRRVYDNGERLSGRFYVSSYIVRQNACEDAGSSHRLYKDDVKGVWLEITQMQPYDPSFIKTYFVPEEATSFIDDSRELGILINPDFLVLDNQYQTGADYLIRIQIENKTGVVNSSGTWHNDIEAFNVMGFTVLEPDLSSPVSE